MSVAVLGRLQATFGGAIESTHSYRGDDTAVVAKAKILDVLAFLRNEADLAFDLPTDLTVVDWLGQAETRFEVVYHLYSTKHRHRVRLKCKVSEEEPTIASAAGLYPGWNWFEREAFDMYGVVFEGHPNLKRMFMYESFVGHPLRKDYPKEKRQPLIRRDGNS